MDNSAKAVAGWIASELPCLLLECSCSDRCKLDDLTPSSRTCPHYQPLAKSPASLHLHRTRADAIDHCRSPLLLVVCGCLLYIRVLCDTGMSHANCHTNGSPLEAPAHSMRTYDALKQHTELFGSCRITHTICAK